MITLMPALPIASTMRAIQAYSNLPSAGSHNYSPPAAAIPVFLLRMLRRLCRLSLLVPALVSPEDLPLQPAHIETELRRRPRPADLHRRSEEHTSELQSLTNLVCR